MIKNRGDIKIDCEALSEQLHLNMSQRMSSIPECSIDYIATDDWLVIKIISLQDETLEATIDIIKQTIEQMQIVSNLVIITQEKVCFASQDDYPSELIFTSSLEEGHQKEKRYLSANFSSGFAIFIFSVLSIMAIGVFYIFSRPCVVDKCELIQAVENNITSDLQNSSQGDLTISEVDILQEQLGNAIQDLRRIPFWSNNHEEAQQLISSYEEIIKELSYFMEANKLVENAENMSTELPLAVNEWQRVNNFLTEAIDQLKLVKQDNFQGAKQEKISDYQERITIVNDKIAQEKLAAEKLVEAEQIVKNIQANQNQVNSLPTLEKLEQQWRNVIQKVESIPDETVAATNKEELINSYLTEIINIQSKLAIEKEAITLLDVAQKDIESAKDSETNNQWTKAVGFWQKASESLAKINSQTFLAPQVDELKVTTEESLATAKISLEEAIEQEKIKAELKTICTQTEKICNYNVSKNAIKIFLTPEYFSKITSLSVLDNSGDNLNKKQQLRQHIKQVENNYKYLSNKYARKVEVYNDNQKLMIVYRQ